MRMVDLHLTVPQENKRLLKEHFTGRTVRECGVAAMAPGEVAHPEGRHVHEDREIFFVLCGEVTVPITDGPTKVARTGDWFVVEPGEDHHVTNHTPYPAVVVYLHVEP